MVNWKMVILVCLVTSGDVDAVYIYLDIASRLWTKDETIERKLTSGIEDHFKDPQIELHRHSWN